MTIGLVRRVIAVYGEAAWIGRAMPECELPGLDTDLVQDGLASWNDESMRAGDRATGRFTLQLGNPDYPFMKLVLQEHLVEGEYFFEVDTHDEMFNVERGAEADELRELKRRNLEIKESVEGAWSEAGLPTAAHIKGLVETRPAPRAPPNGLRILLVDNDRDIAATLGMLLQARGYEVDILADGREAVEQAEAGRHDLILMDNEMKDLNGFEACRVLKSRPETASIPVLIATAGSLTLQQLDAADGFMVKPFRMELLFSILDQLLGRKGAN